MHSPSRVQIPPSPRMTPALREKRGGFVFAGSSHWLARGVYGIKDKKCWFCGDFSVCWCGKLGVEGGVSQLEGWTKRVGFVVTFRLSGAETSVLRVVVSSWGCAYRNARRVGT